MTPRRSTHPGDAPSEPLASPLAAKLTRVALWAFVALGAAGGVLAALRATTTPPVSDNAAAVGDTPPPAGISGVAELAVRRWLSPPTQPRATTVGPAASTVAWTTTVDVRDGGRDRWTVTVAAELASPTGPAPMWFVEVTVTNTATGLLAGTPVVVPPPTDTTAPEARGLRRPEAGDPLADTARDFLTALLTGTEVSRYLAPGVTLVRVDLPLFRQLALERTAVIGRDEDRVVLAAEVAVTTADDVELAMVYELTLGVRDGRWEIHAIGPVTPPTPERRPAPSPTTTSPPPVVGTPGA